MLFWSIFLKMHKKVNKQKIWIWISKIMPDLWLSAVFCQIKQKITPPYCQKQP